jgi:hypothetical protein
MPNFHRPMLLALIAGVLTCTGCGGGSSSSTPTTGSQLSADQKAFEDYFVAPAAGAYSILPNLTYSGAQVSGTNSLEYSVASLPASPTMGAQSDSIPRQDMATTLPLVEPDPNRMLQGGQLWIQSTDPSANIITFTSAGEVDTKSLAVDGTTVLADHTQSGYAEVSLSGPLNSAPSEFINYFNNLFANASVLNPSATFQLGSAYLKWTATANADYYVAVDFGSTKTTDTNVIPVATNTSLSSALTTGIADDGTTYTLGEGAISTPTGEGVPVWVATAPLAETTAGTATTEYRVYFQLDNNVYKGYLIKAGTVMGGNSYIITPASAGKPAVRGYTNYQIRLNKEAFESIQAALQL